MSYENHQLQHWLNELGTEFDTQFTLTNEGSCMLQAGKKTSFALFADELNEGYSISCHLLDLPDQEREQLLSHALSLNMYQLETKGAAIALDETVGALFLCFTETFDKREYQDFKNILDNFIDKAEQLKKELKSNVNKAVGNIEDDGNAMLGMLRL
ncbi:CesT family type III secretion system chaperone [Thalassomonas actiniarum]|uniref:Type III secretion system chaperone n=1 Tax=Thalassomonas actiniarum TaxID=485447 RepID=A0AAF0C1B6_9GAMM|nr:CesT family type III secretion system chaperone [Thalassomonas actiniarum]WDD96595.1 type III secretion system chaperone [Thalassomonas actiniarum]